MCKVSFVLRTFEYGNDYVYEILGLLREGIPAR